MSSASRPDSFMPVFIADYLADTTHLTRDQDGAYLLLLMAYWRRGGPLPADDDRLARIAKASPSEWRKLRPVMLEFFKEIDGLWHNKRSDIELAKANARYLAKSQAGANGAAKRWQTDSTGNGTGIALPGDQPKSNGSRNDSSSPSQNVSSETFTPKAPKGAEYAEDFEAFWKAYPRTKGMSKLDASKAWEKLRKFDRLPQLDHMLAAVEAYKRQLDETARKRPNEEIPVKHAQGWLNGERFAGFLADPKTLTIGKIAASLLEHSPDWADEIPEWAAFKKTLTPREWSLWFSKARPNGAPSTLIVGSRLDRDKILQNWGDRLNAVFDGKFELKLAERTAA